MFTIPERAIDGLSDLPEMYRPLARVIAERAYLCGRLDGYNLAVATDPLQIDGDFEFSSGLRVSVRRGPYE